MTMTTFPHGINSHVRCPICEAPTDGTGRCIGSCAPRRRPSRSSQQRIWAFAVAAALTVGWFAFVTVPAANNAAVEKSTIEQTGETR